MHDGQNKEHQPIKSTGLRFNTNQKTFI